MCFTNMFYYPYYSEKKIKKVEGKTPILNFLPKHDLLDN